MALLDEGVNVEEIQKSFRDDPFGFTEEEITKVPEFIKNVKENKGIRNDKIVVMFDGPSTLDLVLLMGMAQGFLHY